MSKKEIIASETEYRPEIFQPEVPEVPQPPPPREPFRGIESFRFCDQAIFAERREQAARLGKLVVVYRGTLLAGGSGVGKSSLINAGLLPALLEEGLFPERIRVRPEPGREFQPELIPIGEAKQPPFLPSRFQTSEIACSPLSPEQFAERLSDARNRPPVLIFDQFEELVTLFDEAPDSREKFLAAQQAQEAVIHTLGHLLLNHELPIKFLFVFREDYYLKLGKFFDRIQGLREQVMYLEPLPMAKLHKIIREPFIRMRAAGHPFEHEIYDQIAVRLAEAIEERSDNQFINLTETQIICQTLWREEGGTTRFAQATDKPQEIQMLLERYTDERIAEIAEEWRSPAIAVLSKLVTSSGTRNIVAEADLVERLEKEDGLAPHTVHATLTQLVDRSRLLNRQARGDGAYFYDLVSEFLIPWIRRRRIQRDTDRAAETQRKIQKEKALRRVLTIVIVAFFLLAILAATAVFQYQAARGAMGQALVQTQEARRQREIAEAEAVRARVEADRAKKAESDARKAMADLDKQREEIQRQLDKTRESLANQEATVKASTRALAGMNEFRTKAVARLTTEEQTLFSKALEELQTALNKAESGQKTTAVLLENNEQLALEAVRAAQAAEKAAITPKFLEVLTGHKAPITALAFSASEASPDMLATAGQDNQVRLWPRAGGKNYEIKTEFKDGVKALAFSPDGTQLAIGANGPQIHVRQLITGERYDYRGHEDVITSLSFSPDGKRILSSSGDRTVQIWNKGTGLEQKFGPLKSIVTSAVFDLRGERVLASLDDPDHAALLWNTKTEAAPFTLKMNAPVKLAAFSPDGKLAVTAGSGDKSAAIWDVTTGQRLQLLEGHTGPVFQAVFNPGSNTVATASGDKTVRVWNVRDGRTHAILKGHTDAVRQVAFSPDGVFLVTGSADGTARVWFPDDDGARFTLSGHTGPLTSLVISADSRYVATGSVDGTVRLWEIVRSFPLIPGTKWSLYSRVDPAAPDKLRFPQFSRINGDQSKLPAIGEIVKAEAHMNVRDSITVGPDGSLIQGKPVDILRKDTKVKVLELLGPDPKADPQQVWVRYEIDNPGSPRP